MVRAGGIAVLGWGSLLWDLDDLAPKVAGAWMTGHGPRLPMEFSRISPKRRRALVVVLDPEHGRPCPTHAIASRRPRIAAAVADLAARERCAPARIGAVCLESGWSRARAPEIAAAVARWCRGAGWRGAVWTDLLPNFAETTGTPFSVERGVRYLAGLTGGSRAEALRYIASAPTETDTPLRRRLAAEPWWRAALAAQEARAALIPRPPA